MWTKSLLVVSAIMLLAQGQVWAEENSPNSSTPKSLKFKLVINVSSYSNIEKHEQEVLVPVHHYTNPRQDFWMCRYENQYTQETFPATPELPAFSFKVRFIYDYQTCVLWGDSQMYGGMVRPGEWNEARITMLQNEFASRRFVLGYSRGLRDHEGLGKNIVVSVQISELELVF